MGNFFDEDDEENSPDQQAPLKAAPSRYFLSLSTHIAVLSLSVN